MIAKNTKTLGELEAEIDAAILVPNRCKAILAYERAEEPTSKDRAVFKPVKIRGQSLSSTIVEERR